MRCTWLAGATLARRRCPAAPALPEPCRCAAPAAAAGARPGTGRPGDGRAALICLGDEPATAALHLSLGRALLRGNAGEQRQAEERLLALARRQPTTAEGHEASQLLAQQPGTTALAALQQLPANLRDAASVQARLAQEGQGTGGPSCGAGPTTPAAGICSGSWPARHSCSGNGAR